MANIKISDLRPTRSELFSDSESYISELGDSELDIINGGIGPLAVFAIRGGIALALAGAAVVASATSAE